MAKKFYADGNSGRVAIYDPSNEAALNNPLANLHSIYFHSDLDYVGVAADITATIVHPARSTGGGSTQHSYPVPNFPTGVSGFAHDLGYVPFALCFVNGAMIPANTQIQLSGQSFRTVSVQVDHAQVRIYETAWVYGSALPAVSVTYRIVLFTPPIVASGMTTVRIDPTRFVASRGKLDSYRNYLRRSTASPMFWLAKGRTADVSNGSYKIVGADGSVYTRAGYNGSFTGSPGIGVEV